MLFHSDCVSMKTYTQLAYPCPVHLIDLHVQSYVKNRRKKYFHTLFRVYFMPIVGDPSVAVKCRTATKAVFFISVFANCKV